MSCPTLPDPSSHQRLLIRALNSTCSTATAKSAASICWTRTETAPFPGNAQDRRVRAATWWAKPQIYSTTASTKIGCWDESLAKPGAVEIATTGQWKGQTFGLKGGLGGNFNHVKIGVSTSGDANYAIFGDMNQQGASLAGQNCGSSQNGRGGMFFAVNDPDLFASVTALIQGDSAPAAPPAKASTSKKKRTVKK